MKLMNLLAGLGGLLLALPAAAQRQLLPHMIRLANGRALTLNLPAEFTIDVAAQGLRRVRFLAKSPDGRIFATDMDSLADNTRGAVYILEGWDEATHSFRSRTVYLSHLRNPNNVAFYTDASGQSWLYLPLTDKLVRYRYSAGDKAPTSAPEEALRRPKVKGAIQRSSVLALKRI